MVSEELKKELGNALVAYAWILNSAALCCEVHENLKYLKVLSLKKFNEDFNYFKTFIISYK